jgi:hypothetical protein
MLNIHTFDQRQGGNVLYKALAHPLTAEALHRLGATLGGTLALFDPEGLAGALYALHPNLPRPAAVFVQDVARIGAEILGHSALPVTGLADSGATHVLIAAFDAARIEDRLRALAPPGAAIVSLDAARLPDRLLTNRRRYLDRLNFATNHAFFRDQEGHATTLTTANYWSGYGAGDVFLWLRLYDRAGTVLAEWEEPVGPDGAAILLDSCALRARFALPAFCGQLFIHAVGAAGHDVVKYALDTYEPDGASLSCTHDANAWPSDRYAGLPAPRPGERVTLWVQNSHAAPIPDGALTLDRMGAETPVAIGGEIPGFATIAVDVGTVLPGLHWPAQLEIRAGRHIVRPRYEITAAGRTRIAHPNVERADLRPDPGIPALSNLLGRGYLLPFPILPTGRFRTEFQPTPMAETQRTLPLRLDIFAPDGRLVLAHFLGCLERAHDCAPSLDDLLPPDALPEGGHGELVYDFRNGGEADGWMHALIRATDRATLHAAETSFGAHIYNTAMTYRDEPQSYSGPPPGLSTRLFLRLGTAARRGFAVLIYAASAQWHAFSDTQLILHDGAGAERARARVQIPCSGSRLIQPEDFFDPGLLRAAEPGGYLLIRDTTCRLFGYHGLMNQEGGFSLDHMFGF